MRPSLKDASCECLDESSQTAKKRESIEIMLAIDDTAKYAFIEYGCLCKDKKTSNENGESNTRSVITRGATRYL
jgi:hypothetical protein